MKKPIFVLLVLFLGAGNFFAADIAADFNAANRLYAGGKFAAAAAAYEKILQTSAPTTALLFNAGNAEFKSGHLGQAVASYLKAERLSPRDADIRANLAFARNRVQGAASHEGAWKIWMNALTLNEWTLLTVGFFWPAFIALGVRQLRPALGPKLKTATRIFAALTILSGAILGARVSAHFSKQIAVVVSPDATARSGPFDEAQAVFTVRDGAELSVVGQHDDWIQVAGGTARVGWLSRKQLEILPGA
jgi:tetratricopeptide (TPR) repeat protein